MDQSEHSFQIKETMPEIEISKQQVEFIKKIIDDAWNFYRVLEDKEKVVFLIELMRKFRPDLQSLKKK